MLTGFGSKSDSKTLEESLNRATNKDKLDVDKDALLAITQSSSNEDDRRIIMRHIHTCLSDLSSSKWRRANAGMVVVEHLLRHGSPALVTETASGNHFDLVQRLSFLEKYEYSFDKRVENMLRHKALALRSACLEKLQHISACEEEETGHWSSVTRHAWHNEDTDDDLSDDDAVMPEKPKLAQGHLSEPESTTDGESSVSSSPPCQNLRHSSAVLVSATPVDLLGFGMTDEVLLPMATAHDPASTPTQNCTVESLLDF
jgi:hypothetical protein